MGCGSSSLKGEKMGDIAADSGPPARKVNTNFGDVDFSGGAAPDRRSTLAVAPDEHSHARPTSGRGPSTDLAPDATTPISPGKPATAATKTPASPDGAVLEPYHTIEEPGEQVVKQKKEDVHVGKHPSNEEDAALATAGTDTGNPIKVV